MSIKSLNSYDFKIDGVIYSMIGTSVASVKKNLLDYDLPEMPKSIRISKQTSNKPRYLSDDYERKRFMGVPIDEIETPRHQRTIESQIKGW